MVEYLVVGLGLVALLLRGLVWSAPSGSSDKWRRTTCTSCPQGIRAHPTCRVAVAEPELIAGWAEYHDAAEHAHRAAPPDACNLPFDDMKVR